MKNTRKMTNLLTTFIFLCNFIFSIGCSGFKDRTLDIHTEDGSHQFVRYASDIGVPSTILKQPVNIAVLLPDDYISAPEKRYGVVYLLHGLGDTHKAWNGKNLRIEQVVNACEADGLEHFIYIMPAGLDSYYVNNISGNFNYMDFFTEELVPYIDRTYRTIADRGHRAVVGYSMGGFGAMILPTKHPELFSVSVPLSMSFRTDEQYMSESGHGWDKQWGSIFGGEGTSGEERLTDYYKAHCPFYLFTPEHKNEFAEISYYIDCGDDEEQLLVANDELHVQMREIGMPHEYRVRNGAHTGDYWRSAMPEVLRFIECRFNGKNFKPLPIEKGATHKSLCHKERLAGIDIEIFTPEGYDGASEKRYPSLYLFYDETMPLNPDEILNRFSSLQNVKPFIMVACDITCGEIQPDEVVAEVEKIYLMKNDAAHRTVLAWGESGVKSWQAMQGTPLFNSIFLLDGKVQSEMTSADSGPFCFIVLSDEGGNYCTANRIYKSCHASGREYEYRVTDGKMTDKESLLRNLAQILSRLGEKIDIR